MWQHWFRTIALPTLNMYTNHHCLKDEFGLPLKTLFTTDGEDIIIHQIYEANIIAALKEQNVIYEKVINVRMLVIRSGGQPQLAFTRHVIARKYLN